DNQAAVATGSVLVVFYNEDLEAAVQRVTDAGGRISKEIFSFPGGRRFHFQDPCDNEYALWSER
ncbi:MAG: VOC family protein, partial [Woeseia sp.]